MYRDCGIHQYMKNTANVWRDGERKKVLTSFTVKNGFNISEKDSKPSVFRQKS